jgi:hypothetical protein
MTKMIKCPADKETIKKPATFINYYPFYQCFGFGSGLYRDSIGSVPEDQELWYLDAAGLGRQKRP